MGDFDDSFITALRTQSWALYSVGMLLITLRMFGLYTVLIVCLNVISQGGGSNLYPPEMEGTFTPDEIEDRIYGSKIVVVSEQFMLNVIYVIKSCMLIMYTRLTLGLGTQKAVRYLGVYVAVGWVATEVAFFTACRPFEGYWGMPPPNPQCTTLEHYAIVQGCFNISSDTLMLFIPLPLVLKMNMLWKQKIVLVFLFSLGFFVIIAALLTKIFNLTNVWEPSYMLWYVREASVAVYVSNLPLIWPLLRDWFPFLRSLTPGGYSSGYSLKKRKGSGTGTGMHTGDRSKFGSQPQSHRDILSSQRSRPQGHDSITSLDTAFGIEMMAKEAGRRKKGDDSSSTECIVQPGDGDIRLEDQHADGIISVERTVVIEETLDPRDPGTDKRDVYDWKHMGGAKYVADATTGR
ncbi:hypothetical protein GQ53DRAFT_842004 [Thozetella sp. PMI_491]|nr:hypothetical protein GQ53DRAFT_842004 [Thozetella sp. PMI_491]